jgi:hypothetical protein
MRYRYYCICFRHTATLTGSFGPFRLFFAASTCLFLAFVLRLFISFSPRRPPPCPGSGAAAAANRRGRCPKRTQCTAGRGGCGGGWPCRWRERDERVGGAAVRVRRHVTPPAHPPSLIHTSPRHLFLAHTSGASRTGGCLLGFCRYPRCLHSRIAWSTRSGAPLCCTPEHGVCVLAACIRSRRPLAGRRMKSRILSPACRPRPPVLSNPPRLPAHLSTVRPTVRQWHGRRSAIVRIA